MNSHQRHLWSLKGGAFYPCSINGKRASIWLDTSVPHETDLDVYPYFRAIRAYLIHPSGDGLSTNAETEQLHEIEDYLVPAMSEAQQSVYVGRVTTNGYREFYFYARMPRMDNHLRPSMFERFPAYDFSSEDGVFDPTWDTYFDCIYPNDLAYHFIVLQRMMQECDSPPDPVSVTYFFYVDDESTCDRVRQYLDSLAQFETRKDAAAPVGHFRVTATTTQPPDASAVYHALEEVAVANGDVRHAFTHCEVDCDGMLYRSVSSDARLRIAADVEAGLRPVSDLERFGIRLGPPIEIHRPDGAA